MDPILVIGSFAASLTTIAFLPQVIKAHNSRHTKDLSMAMYLLLAVGLVFWIIYGLALGSLPVILANVITLSLSLYLVYLKMRYG